MVASTEESLNRYKKMGFKGEGISFVHHSSKRRNVSVLVLNKDTGKTGKGMNPIKWWEVWGAVSLHLYQRRIIEYSLPQKIRVRFNRATYRANGLVKKVIRRLK